MYFFNFWLYIIFYISDCFIIHRSCPLDHMKLDQNTDYKLLQGMYYFLCIVKFGIFRQLLTYIFKILLWNSLLSNNIYYKVYNTIFKANHSKYSCFSTKKVFENLKSIIYWTTRLSILLLCVFLKISRKFSLLINELIYIF